MCGRFTLIKPAAVQARFGFVDWRERRIERRFNIAPSQDILTIVQHPVSPPVAQEERWAAPHWLQSGRSKPPIDARAETVPSSGLFRRCRPDHPRRRDGLVRRTERGVAPPGQVAGAGRLSRFRHRATGRAGIAQLYRAHLLSRPDLLARLDDDAAREALARRQE